MPTRSAASCTSAPFSFSQETGIVPAIDDAQEFLKLQRPVAFDLVETANIHVRMREYDHAFDERRRP
jgi:hypothetical protein